MARAAARAIWRWRGAGSTSRSMIPHRQVRDQIVGGVANAHPDIAWRFSEANEAKAIGLLDPLQRHVFAPNLVSSAYGPTLADAMLAHVGKNFAGRAQATAAGANVRTRAAARTQRLPAVEAWLAAGN